MNTANSFFARLSWSQPFPLPESIEKKFPTRHVPFNLPGSWKSFDLLLPDGSEDLRAGKTPNWFVFISGYADTLSQPGQMGNSTAQWAAGQLEKHLSLESILQDLDGSFVLLAADLSSGQVYLAGDRIGNSSLYYAIEKQNLLLASHAGVISQALQRKEIDREGLSLYLGLKGIPAPWTPFLGIKKNRPGTVLSIQQGQVIESVYWDPKNIMPEEYSGTMEQAVEAFQENMRQAVSRYARNTSAPLGVFLSGGLDSTFVAATARQLGIPLHAYAAGYEPSYRTDETDYAAYAAAQLNIPFTNYRIDTQELHRVVHENVSALSEPVADASYWPQVYLARKALPPGLVILDGTGADSLLGGSNKFAVKKFSSLYLSLPAFLRKKIILPLSNTLPSSRRSRAANLFRLWQIFVQGCEASAEEQIIYYNRFLRPQMIENLLIQLESRFIDMGGALLLDLYAQAPANRSVAALSYMTIKGIQPWVELIKLKNIEHAAGVSVRKPFLASEMVDLGFRFPDHYKVSGSQRKRVLREAARDLVPEKILHRPKANFSPPVGRWLGQEYRESFFAVFDKQDLFNKQTIEKMYRQQETGYRDWQSELWALYIFELWWNSAGEER